MVLNSSRDFRSNSWFSEEWRPVFFLLGVFYISFIIFTPLGNDISFLPHALEPTGVYHLLHFDKGDDAGYYAYLRSLFFDYDLDFYNEPYYAHNRNILDTGYVANPWKIGPAILWFPFFLLAHLITWLYNILGEPLTKDGLSFIYIASTALASSTYVCLGLIFHYFILRRWFSQEAAVFSVILFFLAVGMVYFTFIRSRMAHANDYFLICLFIFCWLDFRDNPGPVKGISVGLVGGLMMLTRINSATYLLLPIFDFAREVFLMVYAKNKIKRRSLIPYYLLFALNTLVYSLQLNVNRILSGSLSPIPTTGDQASELFSKENWIGIFPNLLKIFFGSNWGLLWHAPVYFFGAVGFYFFVKRKKDPGIPFFIALIPPLTLLMVWPHHGLSYGYRHLLTANILFSIGLAELYGRNSFRLKTVLWSIGSIVLILWSYIQIGLFKVVIPHDSKNFIWQVFKSLKLYLLPQVWLRGENLIFVMFHPNFQIRTQLDWYLIVIHPFLQAMVLLTLLFTGVYIWARMKRQLGLKLRILSTLQITTFMFIVFLHAIIQIQNVPKTPDFIDKRKTKGQFFLMNEPNKSVIQLRKPSKSEPNL